MDTLTEYLKIKDLPKQERSKYLKSLLKKIKTGKRFKTYVKLLKILIAIGKGERHDSSNDHNKTNRERKIMDQIWQYLKGHYLVKKKNKIKDKTKGSCRVLPLFPKPEST